MTTEAIHEAQLDPKPPIYQSALLREQNYGSGEGKKWNSSRIAGLSLEKHYERGVYPALRGRSERFPGGESLVDLALRAERVVDDILLSYVSEEHDEANVAVVSHGLFLSELIAALVRKDDGVRISGREVYARDFRGLKNTGWAKVTATVRVSIGISLTMPKLSFGKGGDARTRRGRPEESEASPCSSG